MAATIHDIAEKTGLSLAAVSKALNDKKDISVQTKEYVKQIARELGYTVNIAARTLATKKTMCIGIVVTFPQIPTVLERIRGIQSVLEENNYLGVTAFHDGSSKSEIQNFEMLCGRTDGIILTPTRTSQKFLADLKSCRIPLVLMSEDIPSLTMDYISSDYFEGGMLTARHLVDSGRTHIAFLGSHPSTYSDCQTISGLKKVFKDSNLSFRKNVHIYWHNSTREATGENISLLMREHPETEAVFAFSDITAIWTMDYLRADNIMVPEEVAVVGYDDNELSASLKISLTSVAQPNFDIGRQAALALMERIIECGPSRQEPKKVVFPAKLMVRESSA